VRVENLLEAVFGRDGSDHRIGIAGRKREVRGSVRGGDDGDAGHALNGAHFSEHVVVKPWRDVGELIDQVKVPDLGMFCHVATSFQRKAATWVLPTTRELVLMHEANLLRRKP
jgi:hypothetical protein